MSTPVVHVDWRCVLCFISLVGFHAGCCTSPLCHNGELISVDFFHEILF